MKSCAKWWKAPKPGPHSTYLLHVGVYVIVIMLYNTRIHVFRDDAFNVHWFLINEYEIHWKMVASYALIYWIENILPEANLSSL